MAKSNSYELTNNAKNELAGKVYGDYNALAINMGVGCDCDPEVKRAIQMDWIGCLKPDKTI
jgi:hypothetical protein